MTATYTAKDLDALFGFKVQAGAGWFHHHWKRMVAKGFPAPIEEVRPALRWRRAQVDAWMKGERAAAPEVPAPAPRRRGFNLAALDRAR